MTAGHAMNWQDWLRTWNARPRKAVAHGCDMRDLLRQDFEALARMPRIDPWPEGQRACDNRGEVDG